MKAKAGKRAAGGKGAAAPVKKGARYSCGVCGVGVTVDEVCGCVDTCDIICCGAQMTPRRK
jgi:hypothetical protein